jgi:hypothetical protein
MERYKMSLAWELIDMHSLQHFGVYLNNKTYRDIGLFNHMENYFSYLHKLLQKFEVGGRGGGKEKLGFAYEFETFHNLYTSLVKILYPFL